MIRHRHQDTWPLRMAKIMMAAAHMVQHEASSTQCADELSRRYDRETVHTFSIATAIVSLITAPLGAASSGGNATPSLASASR